MKDNIQSQGENSYKSENRFTNPRDLFIRFDEIKTKNPKKKSRENIILKYDRTPTKNPRTSKLEPDHGQFKMKIDNYCALFSDFLTETPDRFRVRLPLLDESEDKSSYQDTISAAVQDLFLSTWEGMFIEETKTVYEKTMHGKGIHFWESRTGYQSESIPSCDVYPNLNASNQPKKWDYCFIEKPYTLVELYNLTHGKRKESNITLGWTEEGVEEYLLFKTKDSRSSVMESKKFNRCNVSSSTMESIVSLLHCYVKEYDGGVTKYIIPADNSYLGGDSHSNEKVHSDNFLFYKENYHSCMSEAIAVRTNHITRSYWSSPSFAELIYQSCKFYDASQNAIIRSAIRNMTLFLVSQNPDQADKIRRLGASEVEVLDGDTKIEQNRISVPVQEMTQVVRQVMFDSERESNQSQSPGSQNVKGYAITAVEAKQRALSDDKTESTLIKNFVAQDREYYKELYRRAIKAPSSDEKKFTDTFVRRMEKNAIDKEIYDPKNVIIEPVFKFGGSRANKISFAQSLYSAVSINAATEAQSRAKRVLISAHVGEENVHDYIDEDKEMQNMVDMQEKAGGENEDMDNPYLNPENVPVNPNDKHQLESMFHIKDYKFKLSIAMNIIKAAEGMPVAMKIGFLISAKDLIKAQDNKGAHIEAHFKYWEMDPTHNKEFMQQAYAEFDSLRRSQDELQKQVEKMLVEYIQSNQDNINFTEQQKHTQAMNQMEIERVKGLNDIALGKALEQKDLARDGRIAKESQNLAGKQAVADIEISKKSTLAEIEKNKEFAKMNKQPAL